MNSNYKNFFELHTMRIVLEHDMLTAKFRPFCISLLLFRGLLFLLLVPHYVFERTTLLPTATLPKKDDKMMQLRLHTLNRHRSNCLMDIILKAYSITKALEILVASY